MSVLGGTLQSAFVKWQGDTGILAFVENEPMLFRLRFTFRKGDGDPIVKYLYENDDITLPYFLTFLDDVKDTYFTESIIAKEVDNILKHDNPYGPARYELKLYYKDNGSSETIYCRDWGHEEGLLWYCDIKDSIETTNYIPYELLMKIISREVWNDDDTLNNSVSNS